MTRALIEAEAHLRIAYARYPTAAANLHGVRTTSSAGLLDGGVQSGWPTGHTGSSRLECDCQLDGWKAMRACRRCGLNEDDARRAIATIDRELSAIIRLCSELLDVETPARQYTWPTLHRIHLAGTLVRVSIGLELTSSGRHDADDICRHAGNTRQTITDWAWTTTRGTDTKADEGCRSCARLGTWEPCAQGRYANYCRWCGEWHTAHQTMPPEAVLAKHHRGERITSRDLARIKGRAS
jgi:hypothetical protein